MNKKNKSINKSKNGYRATLQDIARKAGVSVTTVSYIVNGKGSINAETRKRIMEIAASLNYVPNRVAKTLRGGRTNTIGVIINHMHNPFFTEVFRGVERVAGQCGYTYLVSQTHDDLEKERHQLLLLAESGVDGIILLPCSNESTHIEDIEHKYRIHIALIANFFEDRQFLSVVADNRRGARMAVKHLLSLGRRPVVHISGPENQTMCLFRRQAFEQIIAETSPENSPSELTFTISEMSPSEGYNVMPRILSSFSLPISIFAVNDETAFGVMRYCNEKKLRIPQDVAIIGFGDIEILSTLSIPLTTIRIPAEDLGEKVAGLIIDAIESSYHHSKERIVLPVELVVRGSTLL